MPRAGLAPASVTAAGAALADEVGFERLTMGLLAARLGVRVPSLYKHVDGLADLIHRIAVLGATELTDALRTATQGRADTEALEGAARALRAYAHQHPGRYAAGNQARATESFRVASAQMLDSLAAVLRGYRLEPAEEIHALRMLRSLTHGFVVLEAGGAFQLETDIEESFTWILDFIDQGLKAIRASTKGARPPGLEG